MKKCVILFILLFHGALLFSQSVVDLEGQSYSFLANFPDVIDEEIGSFAMIPGNEGDFWALLEMDSEIALYEKKDNDTFFHRVDTNLLGEGRVVSSYDRFGGDWVFIYIEEGYSGETLKICSIGYDGILQSRDLDLAAMGSFNRIIDYSVYPDAFDSFYVLARTSSGDNVSLSLSWIRGSFDNLEVSNSIVPVSSHTNSFISYSMFRTEYDEYLLAMEAASSVDPATSGYTLTTKILNLHGGNISVSTDTVQNHEGEFSYSAIQFIDVNTVFISRESNSLLLKNTGSTWKILDIQGKAVAYARGGRQLSSMDTQEKDKLLFSNLNELALVDKDNNHYEVIQIDKPDGFPSAADVVTKKCFNPLSLDEVLFAYPKHVAKSPVLYRLERSSDRFFWSMISDTVPRDLSLLSEPVFTNDKFYLLFNRSEGQLVKMDGKHDGELAAPVAFDQEYVLIFDKNSQTATILSPSGELERVRVLASKNKKSLLWCWLDPLSATCKIFSSNEILR